MAINHVLLTLNDKWFIISVEVTDMFYKMASLDDRTGVSVAVAPPSHGSNDADLCGAPGSAGQGHCATIVSEEKTT